ncbi:MAG: collagen-like protein [Alphaproteobacteria bacterium]|nr:collagen-like protein [Alphaproteobacteria bacterium]
MRCRGFQFEVGKEYKHEGEVKACTGGFHACEHPLDVLRYYPPNTSRFAIVQQHGDLSRHEEDTKVASRSITVSAEINLAGLIKAAIEYTTSRCLPVDPKSPAFSDVKNGAATASGPSGAATASGPRGAATASGPRGAATASGYSGAATASGPRGAAQILPKDDVSAQHAVAMATGCASKARAPEGSAIVCVYRNDEGELIHIRASKIGENGIKPNVWYSLDENGEFIEV